MATIRETIEFRDRATAVLNNLASNLGKISTDVDRLKNGMNQVSPATEEASASTGVLIGKVKSLAAAYFSLRAAKDILLDLVEMSDVLAESTAKLNLVVDSEHTLEGLKQDVMDVARQTRTEYQATSNLVSKLAMNAGNAFNNSNAEVLEFTRLINESFVISGVNAREATGAITQLTQAMGSGELRGDELRSVLEQAPIIARKVEEYMGWETNSMKTHSQNGEVTAQIVKEAMFAASDEITQMFESMPYTWSQVTTEMRNRFMESSEPLLEVINRLANSEALWGLMDAFFETLSLLLNVLTAFLETGEAVYNLGAHMGEGIRTLTGDIFNTSGEVISFGDALYQGAAIIGYGAGMIYEAGANVLRMVKSFLHMGSEGVITRLISGESPSEVLSDAFLASEGIKGLFTPGFDLLGLKNPLSTGKAWYDKVLSWRPEDRDSFSADFNDVGNVASNTARTASNTGAIKDTLKASASELEYLRRIAERNAIAMATKQTINITMNNDNTISSDTDIDGVISRLITGTKNGMLTIAEGVHA